MAEPDKTTTAEKGAGMNEEFVKQVIAELVAAQEAAFGLLTTALCQQLDPARLHADLQSTLAAAQKLPSTPPLATRLATAAMAAAQAQKSLQAKPADAPHRPRQG